MKTLSITIKTLFGFEEILKEELAELGYEKVTLLNRAVQISGTWEDVYRLNYRCRLAIAVLVEINSFYIHKEEDLYKKARKIDWMSYFDISKTFAVKGAVFSTLFKHSQYPMLVIKDAIVDCFRDQTGERPSVNLKAPQVMFDVYIKDKSVTISLNTSGVPLFQRGYRQDTGDAPINEVLAAGLLRLSGWDKKTTLIDPMCGSGTIAIEAALWAADIPAMIERSHYAFKNFKSFQPEVWEKVKTEGNKRPINLGFKILGFDIDREMVQKAKRNSSVAPIGNMIQFERQDFFNLSPEDSSGTIIFNPPYGERIGEEIEEMYQKIGDTFKNNFKDYKCWLISSNIDALKNIGLKPSKKIKVFNGSLECSFREFDVFDGSYKEMKEKEEKLPGEEKYIQKPVITSPKKVKLEQLERAKRKKPESSQEKSNTSSGKYSSNNYQGYTSTRKTGPTPNNENSLKDKIERIKQRRNRD